MSDVRPGADWWQAADGRWYPPELRPGQRLVRDERGATILSREEASVAATHADTPDRVAHDHVGGPIHDHTGLYLGRPAGLQNRPAAWLALIGAMATIVGAVVAPWAWQTGIDGSQVLGWRDASDQPGGGAYVLLIGITVATISVRCMAGSYSLWWRRALVALAATTLAIAVVEAVRIQQAIDEVATLTRGSIELSFGPGLAVVALGSLVVLVAAGAFRVGSPD